MASRTLTYGEIRLVRTCTEPRNNQVGTPRCLFSFAMDRGRVNIGSHDLPPTPSVTTKDQHRRLSAPSARVFAGYSRFSARCMPARARGEGGHGLYNVLATAVEPQDTCFILPLPAHQNVQVRIALRSPYCPPRHRLCSGASLGTVRRYWLEYVNVASPGSMSKSQANLISCLPFIAGATTCASGSVCTEQNDYYSQCM